VYAAKDCTKDSGSSTSYRWGGFKDKSRLGPCGKYSDNQDGPTCVYDVGANTSGHRPKSSGCREATSGKKAVCFECGTGTYDLMSFEFTCIGTTTSSWTGCGDKIVVKPPVVTKCTEGAKETTSNSSWFCTNPTPCSKPGHRSCNDPYGTRECISGSWVQTSCKNVACFPIQQECR
jgi:hypothetical protein